MRIYLWVLLCLMITTRVTWAAEPEPKVLKFGVLPYITATELIKKYTPLAQYLSQVLEREVMLSVAKNYQEHIRQAGKNELDITFIGGLPYVTMVKEYGKKRLLARYEMQHQPHFRSIIFVPQQSPIQSLTELSNKRFAFGNENSTLSTLVPRYMLQQENILLNNLAQYEHLKTHEDVILSVLLGSHDAGAVAQEVFNEYKEKYQLRKLASSPPISTHLLVVGDHISDVLYQKIQATLYNLKTRPQFASPILNSINKDMTGFVPVQNSHYDLLRDIMSSTQY